MGLLNIDKPTVFRSFDMNIPGWDFFIQHANYARNSGGNMIRIFDSYYFVVQVFDNDIAKTIHGYKDFYNKINENHDRGIQARPVFLISYFNDVENLGKHEDGFDQFFWNCIGHTTWEFEQEDGSIEKYILNPGDLMAIPAGVYHKVTSVTPRAGMTFSSN